MDKLFTKATVERTDKGMLAVASTAVEDRHGEVVTVDGWDIKNFKKNPVLLWAHNHDEIAVGRAKNIKVDTSGKKPQLTFEPVFHDKTPVAAALKALYEGIPDEDLEPVLNSFSVGFRALEMDGNTYTEQELLEISAVNVPANPEARVIAYKTLEAAGIDKGEVEKLHIMTTGDNKPDEDDADDDKDDADDEAKAEIAELKKTVAEQGELISDLVQGLKHLNPTVGKKDAIEARITLQKVIVRAADKLLEGKPKQSQSAYVKVIKRAGDKLLNNSKQELKING